MDGLYLMLGGHELKTNKKAAYKKVDWRRSVDLRAQFCEPGV